MSDELIQYPDKVSIEREKTIKGAFRFRPDLPFEEWKKSARADLMDRLGLTRKFFAERVPLSPKILWQRKVENGTVTKMTLQAEKGYSFPIYLCIPEGQGPFPVWICVQGHGTGMHVSLKVKWQDETTPRAETGDRDLALQCLEKGYAAICIEQRAFGENSVNSDRTPGCAIQAPHAFMFGETLIGNRVFDIDRAIDFIYTRDDLRKDRIGVTGNSGGGTASIYSGAILDRLTHVMPSCCFSTYRDSILAVPHCHCNYFPGMLEWGDMGDLAALCAPKYLVIINGRDDTIFPLGPAEEEFRRAQEAYRTAGCPDRCRLVVGNGGHRFYKADAWSAMDPFLKS